MFEHFSFPSPSSTAEADDRLMPDCDSATISPLSSRCPSPSSSPYISRRPHPLSRPRSPYRRRQPPPPTSMPSNYEQFQRRISVGTLTDKLNAHTLDHNDTTTATTLSPHPTYDMPLSPISPTSFSFSVTKDSDSRGSIQTLVTPPGEFEDEGYDEQLAPGWESYAPFPTSIPGGADSNNLLLHPPSDTPRRLSRQPSLRLQRLQMSRAQCNIDVLKLALMAENFTRRTSESPGLSDEECHPSSMPLDISPHTLPRRSSVRPRVASSTSLRFRSQASGDRDTNNGMARRRSTSSAGTFAASTRIAKPRARDLHTKRSEQTLRRQSLVCAALASTPSSP